MISNVTEISKDQLLSEAQKMSGQGYRFVTASCVDLGEDKLNVIYHFDKNTELTNFRIAVKRGEEVPSISATYLCAVLVENEMKELFGLNVTNIAIDYGGHFLLTPEALKNPQSKITIVQKGDN
ncbi:MAG: NADH-quinone oxidoreductase subunit C [Nitrospirota bacterium]